MWCLVSQVLVSSTFPHISPLHPNPQTMSYLHLSSTRNLRSSQAKDHKVGSTCNPARLYGAFLGQALPHFLCSSPSLKYRANSIWCTFPELFCRCEKSPRLQQKEDVKDLMTTSTAHSPRPPGGCSPLWHHPVASSQPVRELCTNSSQILWPPPPQLAFKSALWKCLGELEPF